MALFFADLVREACWATGAGNLALSGALPGHRTFAAAVPAGARFHYAICGVTHPEEWETGEGEIVGGALARTPIASSAGGVAVALSAGLKTAALTVSADWFAARDDAPAIQDVVGLETALAAKAPASHGHDFAGLTGRPTTLAGYGITDAAAAAHHHDGAYQPQDADLTAISGLATTAFGRAQLALADAAALRGHAGLGSLAIQAADAVAISGGTIVGINDLAVADGGTGASSAPAARANLGLGSAATKSIGTAGDAVPVLDGGATTWAAGAMFGGPGAFSGALSSADRLSLSGGSSFGAALTDSAQLYRSESLGLVVAGAGTSYDFYLGNKNGGRVLQVPTGSVNAEFGGSLSASGALSIGGSQVVATRRTGWTAPSGVATRTGFDPATITTEALAQRVKALIDDLTVHGLIGG
jgi:hypothetical protein